MWWEELDFLSSGANVSTDSGIRKTPKDLLTARRVADHIYLELDRSRIGLILKMTIKRLKFVSGSLRRAAPALNISAAITLGLYMTFILSQLSSEQGSLDIGYCLRLATTRTADLFHVSDPFTRLVLEAPAWQRLVSWNLTICLLLVAIFLLAIVLFRMIEGQDRYKSLAEATGFFSITFGFPLAFVFVALLTTDFPAVMQHSDTNLVLRVFIPFASAELVIALAVRYVHQRFHNFSRFSLGFLLSLHYLVWGFVLISWVAIDHFNGSLLLLQMLVFVFPICGALYWVKRKTASPVDAERHEISRPSRIGTLFLGIASLAIFLFLFGPRPFRHHLPTDSRAVVLRVWQSTCFGNCPSYDLTVRGDGLVQFNGYSGVRVYGNQTMMLNPADTARIIELLRSSEFFSLDDRAFTWCFDTQNVGVALTSNGTTRYISSDAGCIGPRNGHQARFVRLAHEIEALVKTDQWVKR